MRQQLSAGIFERHRAVDERAQTLGEIVQTRIARGGARKRAVNLLGALDDLVRLGHHRAMKLFHDSREGRFPRNLDERQSRRSAFARAAAEKCSTYRGTAIPTRGDARRGKPLDLARLFFGFLGPAIAADQQHEARLHPRERHQACRRRGARAPRAPSRRRRPRPGRRPSDGRARYLT